MTAGRFLLSCCSEDDSRSALRHVPHINCSWKTEHSWTLSTPRTWPQLGFGPAAISGAPRARCLSLHLPHLPKQPTPKLRSAEMSFKVVTKQEAGCQGKGGAEVLGQKSQPGSLYSLRPRCTLLLSKL